MQKHRCVYPLHRKKPRCRKKATTIVVVGDALVRTCKLHRSATATWTEHELRRQRAKRAAVEQSRKDLAEKAEAACSAHLLSGRKAICEFALSRIDFRRLSDRDLRALIAGRNPRR